MVLWKPTQASADAARPGAGHTLVQRVDRLSSIFVQWMIAARRRLKSEEVAVALGNEKELAILQLSADNDYAAGRRIPEDGRALSWIGAISFAP